MSEQHQRAGIKGGYARAAKLSPERRQEIAVKAVKTRWRRWRKAKRLAERLAAEAAEQVA